jgi:lipoate-protein ligase A
MSKLKNKYKLIVDPPSECLFNMEKDFELAKNFKIGDTPIFRLYSWNPHCLSLGYNQKDNNINKDKLNSDNIDLVRRPTGGRAVLHSNELTYSVITQVTNNYTKQDIYKEVHQLIAEVFISLGVEVDFVKTNPDFKNFYKSDERSVSCFASSARYELTYDNKKIVGSAQRIYGNTLLQHGSILLDYGFENIAEYVSSDKDKINKLKDFTLKTAIPLNAIAPKTISLNELIQTFKKKIH